MCVCVLICRLLYTNPSRLYALCMLDVFDCFRWNIQQFINRTNFTLEKKKDSGMNKHTSLKKLICFFSSSFYRLKLKMMHPRLNIPLSQENPLWISWHDTAWIAVLNPTNVMDYFMEKSNPFYDRTCNNEIVKMQRQSFEHLK